MVISERIPVIKKTFIDASEHFYYGDNGYIVSIKNELDDAMKLINIFIGVIPSLMSMGLEIPRDVIERQIENVQESLKCGDYCLLADTLRYELSDTLVVIEELVAEGVIKDEELF